AIREQGGVPLPDGDRLVPDPILVGRNEAKLRDIAAAHGLTRVSTDLDACLANPADEIYFDATLTSLRVGHVGRAIVAGKHVYCGKPVAASTRGGLELARSATLPGLKHRVVPAKLFPPGLRQPTPPTPRSRSTAPPVRSSHSSIRRGRFASTAMTCCRSRSTAPWGAPSRPCAAARSRVAPRRRARCGTPTCPTPPTSTRRGRTCP